MKHRRALSVEIVNQDAAQFVVPDDVNVCFFFNPFDGETLRQVTERIGESYRRRQRNMFIIYIHNHHFEKQMAESPWLRKQDGGVTPYPHFNYGLYAPAV